MSIKLNDFHFLVLSFLFFCLATSNHFLIFNEETVVAICFISFIIFSFQFFGNSVQESLDERAKAIETEFYQALLLELQYCQEVMYEYEKPINRTGAYVAVVKDLLTAKLHWYQHFRKQSLSTFFSQSLRKLIDSKLEYRVKQLTLSKKVFQEKWLDLMGKEFEASVLASFQTTNNEAFQEVLLTESLSAVKKEKGLKKK